MYHSEPVVKIIADSYSSEHDVRLTTFELEYWRAILPEVNTHRAFSRCTVSNRAMPTDKLIEKIKTDPWGPNHFFKNCKGMVGSEEYSLAETNTLKAIFNQIATSTAVALENTLKQLSDYGFNSIHKQTINRLLEPYQSVKTVLTADQFALEHFFKLRCAKDAQPEMQDLANKMKEVYNTNTPMHIAKYGVHCPYVSDDEYIAYVGNSDTPKEETAKRIMDILKASAMRCARVSYDKLDGTKASIADDAKSCEDKLIKNEHMSPLEMPCVVDGDFWEKLSKERTITYGTDFRNSTNICFPFVQLRKLIETDTCFNLG